MYRKNGNVTHESFFSIKNFRMLQFRKKDTLLMKRFQNRKNNSSTPNYASTARRARFCETRTERYMTEA